MSRQWSLSSRVPATARESVSRLLVRLTTDDKVDSVVDGYNVPVRYIAVLTLPRGRVTCSVLKSGVASKQAVRFKKSSEY